MNSNRSIVIFGAVVLAMAVGLFFLYSAKETEHNIRVQKELELRNKVNELTQVQTDLEILTKQKKEAEDSLNAKIGTLNQLVKDYETNIRSQSDRISQLTQEADAARREKETQSQKISVLTKKLQLLEKEKNELGKKIQELETHKKDFIESDSEDEDNETIGSIKTDSPLPNAGVSVSLGNIVVQKSSGKTAMVENVNKMYGFLIISAGTNDGLSKNMVVNIVRDGRLIGKALVEKPRENMSAVIVLPEWTQGEIRVGDAVSVV